MDGLRWLLLLFGLLVIAGVYYYSRREKSDDKEERDPADRVEPRLESGNKSDLDAADAIPRLDDTDEPAPEVEDQAVDPAIPQKIVAVRLVAKEKEAFAGDELVLSMRGIGLRHGKFGIFHRYDGNDEGRTVFSAASLIEPGSFDLQNIQNQEIPGISLFLVLPGPIDCVEAFDLMMESARTLTQSLAGELLDESGSTLSIQRERYLREEIIQFQHSHVVD